VSLTKNKMLDLQEARESFYKKQNKINNKFISVSGLIGSGKTTFCRKITSHIREKTTFSAKHDQQSATFKKVLPILLSLKDNIESNDKYEICGKNFSGRDIYIKFAEGMKDIFGLGLWSEILVKNNQNKCDFIFVDDVRRIYEKKIIKPYFSIYIVPFQGEEQTSGLKKLYNFIESNKNNNNDNDTELYHEELYNSSDLVLFRNIETNKYYISEISSCPTLKFIKVDLIDIFYFIKNNKKDVFRLSLDNCFSNNIPLYAKEII